MQRGTSFMVNIKNIIKSAWENGLAIPAFNVYYLPAIRAIIEAVKDENAFALVQTCRIEWTKFDVGSIEKVFQEYIQWRDEGYVALHLDHIPVIDEDDNRVEFLTEIKEALGIGYDSVMVDG